MNDWIRFEIRHVAETKNQYTKITMMVAIVIKNVAWNQWISRSLVPDSSHEII